MNLHHLRYFADAAFSGSVTAAAAKNHVTQSAVSQAIRSLEEQLGVELIAHRRNDFELTEAGELVLLEAEQVFRAIDGLKVRVTNVGKKVEGVLRIAATNSLAQSLLRRPLLDLAGKYPRLRIELRLGNSDQVREYLRTKETEFGLILEEDEHEELEKEVLRTGSFLLVKAKAAKIADRIIITRENKPEIRDLKSSWKKLKGKEPQFSLQVFSWEMIRSLCLEGEGVGYLPDYLVEEDLKKKSLQRVEPGLKTFRYKVLSVKMKGRVLSHNAEVFLQQLRD